MRVHQFISGLFSLILISGCQKGDTLLPTPPSGFVYIPASTNRDSVGSALYLDSNRQDDESPRHSINVDAFFMGKTEVTRGAFKIFLDANANYGSQYNKISDYDTFAIEKPELPILKVSWIMAARYCNWYSIYSGIKDTFYIFNRDGTFKEFNTSKGKYAFRLPTEAEWEYACRAGSDSIYSVSRGGVNVISYTEANYGNSIGQTTPVGSYAPNFWGLYDMHGNLWEWCDDFYDANFYASSKSKTPNPRNTTPSVDFKHSFRGGWWHNSVLDVRTSNRFYAKDTYRGYDVGFRMVQSAK